MSRNHQYDSRELEEYQKNVVELGELRKGIGDSIGTLDLAEAERAFDELTPRTKEVDSLCSSHGVILEMCCDLSATTPLPPLAQFLQLPLYAR
jgi:hypothetical protein